MDFIYKVLSRENMIEAFKQVKANKGSAGVDSITVEEIDEYIKDNWSRIKQEILNKKYKPAPIKRVYIPKGNGKTRPLGIPIIMDRIIQQAIAQQLTIIYEPVFSDNSYGFRPGRSCEMAIVSTLEHLNDGYEWVIDLDLEKFFDTINHDKIISLIRKRMNDATTLHLIRSFLKAGAHEGGKLIEITTGAPQGGNISPIISNIMLDEFDKELESRGLKFVRYADDCNIFLKSEKAANRVMKSVTKWLKKKLFLKVNATKTKIVRPTKSKFLGFGYFKNTKTKKWEVVPHKDSRAKLKRKVKQILCRRRAAAYNLSWIFLKLNQVMRGWINYFGIGMMKGFMKEFGTWMRHKLRVVILKQWKKAKTIYKNLQKLGTGHRNAYKVANSSLGHYRRAGLNVVNFALSPKVLAKPNKKKKRAGLINPLEYYLCRYNSFKLN